MFLFIYFLHFHRNYYKWLVGDFIAYFMNKDKRLAKNNYMLDIKSKLVLKILVKECPYGSYNIIESKDILSAMPNKYKIDMEGLENILIFLERQEYISIKYDDDGVFCLCVLPFGYEILENDSNKKREDKKSPPLWLFIILSLLFAFIGAILGSLISTLLF